MLTLTKQYHKNDKALTQPRKLHLKRNYKKLYIVGNYWNIFFSKYNAIWPPKQ